MLDEAANSDPPLPTTFLGPSESVGHTYGEILFDGSRGHGEAAFPGELSRSDLVEGDLFVLPRNCGRERYNNARVLLVMTPSCDLRPRAPHAPPTARNVLLLPGELKLVTRETKGSSLADADYVRVQEGGTYLLLQVTWEHDRPLSKTWSEMITCGPGVGYVRLGRIRDLYFHKVRDQFLQKLSRIGTEVAPLLPHAKDGEVSIRVRGGRHLPVMEFSSSQRLLWEVGPVRVKDKSHPVYVYQASREFIDVVSRSLAKLAESQAEHSESIRECTSILQDMGTYLDLIRPGREGNHGLAGKVQLKAIDRDGRKPRSQANLLVLVYKD